MKAARAGRIVNISSGAGLGISLTGIQAYASAKAAQIGLTRQLAHELGPWDITVNNIAPGFVRSNPATERQWEVVRRSRARARSSNASRSSDSAHPTTSPTACCSSRPNTRTGSPARCSRSTAESDVDRHGARAISRRITNGSSRELIEFAAIPSVSTDPAHAADMSAAARVGRRRARCGRPDHGAHDRDAGQSRRLWRMARRAGEADGPRLRSLRRAAARSAREMASPAVRANAARRPPLRARRVGRQGADADPDQGRRAFFAATARCRST